MSKNMGTVDRVIRVLFAVAVAALILSGTISGALAIILGLLAAVLVVTSIVGFCPLYAPFKISTISKP